MRQVGGAPMTALQVLWDEEAGTNAQTCYYIIRPSPDVQYMLVACFELELHNCELCTSLFFINYAV